MANDTFKKLAFFGRSAKKKKEDKEKEKDKKKAIEKIQKSSKTAKKKTETTVALKKGMKETKKKGSALSSTEVERKIEQNTLKSMRKPMVIILFILAVIFALGSILVVYGPYAGYLQMDYNIILIAGAGMLFLSFILLVMVSILKFTGYIKIQRTVTKVSFLLSLILCAVMLFLKARDPAYFSIATAALFLVFNRIFARKNLLDY